MRPVWYRPTKSLTAQLRSFLPVLSALRGVSVPARAFSSQFVEWAMFGSARVLPGGGAPQVDCMWAAQGRLVRCRAAVGVMGEGAEQWCVCSRQGAAQVLPCCRLARRAQGSVGCCC